MTLGSYLITVHPFKTLNYFQNILQKNNPFSRSHITMLKHNSNVIFVRHIIVNSSQIAPFKIYREKHRNNNILCKFI